MVFAVCYIREALKKGVAGCAVYTYQRRYPSKLLVGSKVFILECQLRDFFWIAKRMLLGGSSSYGAPVLFVGYLKGH